MARALTWTALVCLGTLAVSLAAWAPSRAGGSTATPSNCAQLTAPTATMPPNLPSAPPGNPGNLPQLNSPDVQAAIARGNAQAAANGMPGGASPSTVNCIPRPSGNEAAAIFAAAEAFYNANTCGLHGAPGNEACMAAVNQVIMNAGYPPIGPGPYGTNYIPTAVVSGRMQQIPQAMTVPGDLVVTHSRDEVDWHIGVCETYGCTSVLSNASSVCRFVWRSGPSMDYPGSPYTGGYSLFYHVT